MQEIQLSDTPGCIMRGLKVENLQTFIDSNDDLKFIPMVDINGVLRMRKFPRITRELLQLGIVSPPPPHHCIGVCCPDMMMVDDVEIIGKHRGEDPPRGSPCNALDRENAMESSTDGC